jgi:exodeoxyribonuclease VII small subunit
MSNKSHLETAPSNFESTIAELETIVEQMESGNLSLDASLTAYKRGASLIQLCQKSVAEAEQQVQLLDDANQLNPFMPNQE